MENIDNILDLITKHWKVLGLLILGFTTGAYQIARWRASGMRKLIAANKSILDDLDSDLLKVRRELNQARQDHSEALARAYTSEASVARLEQRVNDLTERERSLLEIIEKITNEKMD